MEWLLLLVPLGLYGAAVVVTHLSENAAARAPGAVDVPRTDDCGVIEDRLDTARERARDLREARGFCDAGTALLVLALIAAIGAGAFFILAAIAAETGPAAAFAAALGMAFAVLAIDLIRRWLWQQQTCGRLRSDEQGAWSDVGALNQALEDCRTAANVP